MGEQRNLRTVTFDIRVPWRTWPDERVYLAGSHRAAGAWRPDGVVAAPRGEYAYRATARLPVGQTFRYKITRGSWHSAEVDALGRPIPDRSLLVGRRSRVVVRVKEWADRVSRPHHTGHFQDLGLIGSRHLPDRYHVVVHLPPGYRAGGGPYPVLIMQDGQNLFDPGSSFLGIKWAVDEAIDDNVRSGRMPPVIAVGVSHGPHRLLDYDPYLRGVQYGKFLTEDLLPILGRHFCASPESAGIAGSSMGGAIALFLGYTRPEVFTRVAALSPSLTVGEGRLFRELGRRWFSPRGSRWWVDYGTAEPGGRWAPFIMRYLNIVLPRSVEHVVARCVSGGRHDETSWRDRLPRILQHLYPPGSDP